MSLDAVEGTIFQPESPRQSTIQVVLPCLNEAAALPAVLAGLPEGVEAIVVDNGSTDDSAAVARSLGAIVVSEPQRGFGAACHRGLITATAPILAFCDADGSFDLAELDRVCAPVIAGEADLVLGRRRQNGRGSWPAHARAANFVLARLIRRRTGYPVHDLGPMRAASRTALLDLGITDRGFAYPLEMVLRASKADWTVREVEVSYHPRIGRSKVTGTVRGTWRAIRDMRRTMRELA